MLNDIFMWIYSAVGAALWFVVKWAGIAFIGIGFLSLIWPYISGVVKFFIIGIPAAIVIVLLISGEVLMAISVLAAAVVAVGALWLIVRFLDNRFGILVTEEETLLEDLL